MILGPRLLGQGRIDEFRKLVHLHRWMALFFGVAFTVIAYLTSEVSVADEFTNKVGMDSIDRSFFEVSRQ